MALFQSPELLFRVAIMVLLAASRSCGADLELAGVSGGAPDVLVAGACLGHLAA